MRNIIFILLLLGTFFILQAEGLVVQKVVSREAKSTLTPIELDISETLSFRLGNGQVRTLQLLATDARVIITNHNKLCTPQSGGGTLYHITCNVLVDGHPMTMERYIGSQESFYEPYVINGMRIWFDGVADIFDKGIVTEEHGKCKPGKAARIGITDMTGRICPEIVYPSYDNPQGFIDIADTYNGDNCWMGAYNGYQAHGGLDVNLTPCLPNYTPIAFDHNYLFNSLANKQGNNRWRATRKWENGDIWIFQNHHLINLLVPEKTPLGAGIHFAEASGVNNQHVHHSHFVFRLNTPDDAEEILLDPWILFWQAFEDNKEKNGAIKAAMKPFSPAKTGESTSFSSQGSRPGDKGRQLQYYWTFGDGGWSDLPNPAYRYSRQGIYPVTLTVDDGTHKATFTQHITVDGPVVSQPAAVLSATDEPSFRLRPLQMMDTYGIPVRDIPHMLHFTARETRPEPLPKILQINNIGQGKLPGGISATISYLAGSGWLKVVQSGNGQQFQVSVNTSGMPTGNYRAKVVVKTPEALNPEQGFMVALNIPTHPPMHWKHTKTEEVIHHGDLRYNRFYATPYFWVRPQFNRWVERGYRNDFYLTNGGRAIKGEYCRFKPDLEAGTYRAYFPEETPFEPERRANAPQKDPMVVPVYLYPQQLNPPFRQMPVNPEYNPESRFAVRVVSKSGEQTIWIEPSKSREIGTFEFFEGMDGYVDVLAEGSTGQVLVDAIVFERIIFTGKGRCESKDDRKSSNIKPYTGGTGYFKNAQFRTGQRAGQDTRAYFLFPEFNRLKKSNWILK